MYISPKSQHRQKHRKKATKHVRISAKLHRLLKITAAEEGIPMTEVFDRVCDHFLEDLKETAEKRL